MIDCFTFYNGLDILEIRLNCLAPYVDRFILVESPYDMVGKEKPLYFNDNKERFKNFNITHLVVHDHLEHMGGWTPYYYQIDYMMREIEKEKDDQIVLLSDFDEFPDLTNYQGLEGIFKQRMYYYYLNVYTGKRNWRGTVATKKGNIKDFSLLRKNRKYLQPIGSGWHFSYVCSPEEIVQKIEAFCHQELNRPEIKARVADNKAKLLDVFNRKDKPFTVEMPSGPAWLLANKDKFNHLFYQGEIS